MIFCVQKASSFLYVFCFAIMRAAIASSPSLPPTLSPTIIPNHLPQAPFTSTPIALHQLVVVGTAGSALIRLQSYDTSNNNKVTFRIQSLPSTGRLQQLSHVFSAYGHEPKAGLDLAKGDIVTGSSSRVLYSRPSPDVAHEAQQWGTFDYTATSEDGTESLPGTVTLVPPSGALVSSSFLLHGDGWVISGNRARFTNATHEPYSRGALLNHYVIGVDDKISVSHSGAADQALWYFDAPSKFLGNRGIAYGGELQFILGAFAGDFSALNGDSTNVVELHCAECPGPVSRGVTLGFPISSLRRTAGGVFTGTARRFSIPLVESSGGSAWGWRKDPQNSLLPWTAATQCDLVQVLSRLSGLRVLGDWTVLSETVAMDDVRLVNTKGRVPLCAMSRPDASVCIC